MTSNSPTPSDAKTAYPSMIDVGTAGMGSCDTTFSASTRPCTIIRWTRTSRVRPCVCNCSESTPPRPHSVPYQRTSAPSPVLCTERLAKHAQPRNEAPGWWCRPRPAALFGWLRQCRCTQQEVSREGKRTKHWSRGTVTGGSGCV
jgi:hypothetical protein